MLRINRFTAQYSIPKSYPNLATLKDSLDGLVRNELTQALAVRLEKNNAVLDESIWIIRRLHMQIDVDPRLSAERISNRWAEEIMHVFERALESPSDAVCFRNEADFLRAYLLESATGNASEKWYFQRFDGLSMLQPSAAIRTVLTRDPGLGMISAAMLGEQEWMTVASALTESDAGTILRCWTGSGSSAASCAQVWAIWQGGSFNPPSSAGESRTALRLTAAALRADPSVCLAGEARGLATLTRLFRDLSEGSVKALVDALSASRIPRLYQLIGVTDGETVTPWNGSRRELLQGVAAASRRTRTDRAMTRFGGLFLLFPFFAELPLDETATALGLKDVGMLRYLIALKCFGQERTEEFLDDPVVCQLFGLGDRISTTDVSDCLRRSTRRVARAGAVLRDWLKRESYCRDNTVAVLVAERKTLVTVDLTRNIWVKVERAGKDAMAQPEGSPASETRFDRIGAELKFLDFHSCFRASWQVNACHTTLANVVLRNFSWRLPGFHNSSIPYLHANFLNLQANIERGEGSFKVRLSRPPLQVILSVTGMLQRDFHVPWLRECISLTPEME